jgi:hypothetical protein
MNARCAVLVLVTLLGLIAAPLGPCVLALPAADDAAACCCPLCACQDVQQAAGGVSDGAGCPCSVDRGPQWPGGPALPASEAASTAPQQTTPKTWATAPGRAVNPGEGPAAAVTGSEPAPSKPRAPSLSHLCRQLC